VRAERKSRMPPPGWSVLLGLLSLAPAMAAPWPVPVEGWVAPAPDEHPRLFFRPADVPRLRERADTPEGRVMVRRLREMLNGADGESLPGIYPKSKAAYEGLDKNLPRGAYTLWHGAGYGMLYQLTGDAKYAAFGRDCVEKAFAGVRDRDDRYAFVDPGGYLRAGPSVSAIAMAYDLCHAGWDVDFRRQVALKLQNYDGGITKRDGGGPMTMERLALRPRLHPGSNHWGAQVGGAALTLLAIRGDAGTDTALIDKYLASVQRNTVRALTEGFGDGGYFMEHAGPGQIASDVALLPAIQAWRVAGGLDFLQERPNATMVTMIRCYELLRKPGGGYHYPLRHPSSYGTQAFERDGLSRGGQIAQGFGAIPEAYRPALLWTCNHVLEPDPAARTYDTVSPYPHRAVLALVNWPIGVAERNPIEVLPRVLRDTKHGYFLFRNRWQDENDILVTALLGARNDGREPIMVWGLGRQLTFPVAFGKFRTTHFAAWPDGGGTFSAAVRGGNCCVAVGFGDDSCFVAMTAPGLKPETKAEVRSVVEADRTWIVLTLQRGDPPALEAIPDGIRIGTRTLTCDGNKIE
jgi:hypothetical protein